MKAIIAVCATHDRYEDDIHHMGGCLLTDSLEWGATLPVILGSVWNEEENPPPEPASPYPDNDVCTIVTRSRHELTFDDTPGGGSVRLKTRDGREIVLDLAAAGVPMLH